MNNSNSKVRHFLDANRRTGNTTTMIGTANGATTPTLVVCANQQMCNLVKLHIINPMVKVVSIRDPHWHIGHHGWQILLDNAAIWELAADGEEAIEKNIDLRGKYEAVVKTLERIKGEADGAKRHAEYLNTERQRLIGELADAKKELEGVNRDTTKYAELLKERDDILNHKWQLEDRLRAVRTALDS